MTQLDEIPKSEETGATGGHAPPKHEMVAIIRAPIYFTAFYLTQGVLQAGALLNQPVRKFLAESEQLNTRQVAQFILLLQIPWMIKPVFGLISDFVPLWGSRRKSYLLLLNLVGAASLYYSMSRPTTQSILLIALLSTAVVVAASNVLVDALLVRTGQDLGRGRVRVYLGLQWACLGFASIVSALGGSYLCHRWTGDHAAAVRIAAQWAIAFPLAVFGLTLVWVSEAEDSSSRLAAFRKTSRALGSAMKCARLWVIAIFLFLIAFNPGTGTALYRHLKESSGLSYAALGTCDAAASAGSIIGTLVFLIFLRPARISTRQIVCIGLLVCALGFLPMTIVTGRISGAIAFGILGGSMIIANLGAMSLAAEACPRRIEASVFAALMALANISSSLSEYVGASLYEGYFSRRIAPLLLISAGFTLSGLFFVLFLRGGDSACATEAGAKQTDGSSNAWQFPKLEEAS